MQDARCTMHDAQCTMFNLLNLNQMKKFITFVLAALVSVVSFAADVVFDFTNPSSLNPAVTPSETVSQGIQLGGTSYTAGDVTIEFTTSESNGAKLWTNTNGTYELRFYQPNEFKISSKGDNIKAVQFSFSDRGGIEAATGTIDGTGMWTGDASDVTFKVPEKASASKIKSITVTIGAAPVGIDTLDVKEAVDLIKAAAGQKLTKSMCVRGVVTGIDPSGAAQYGNINVWMADITGATDTIEAYRMKSFNGEKYTSASDIQFSEGDTIIFFSSDWSYYADGAVYEGSGCTLMRVYGGGHPREIETITVEQALEIGNALTEDNPKTTEVYIVEGYVVKAYDFDESYKNQSFYMSDDAAAERGDFFAKYTTGDVVVVGDKVQVKGQIEKYVKDDKTTIQIYKGVATIVSHVGLKNVKAASKAVKTIENGQFVIEANGVRYNVLGTAL